METDPDGDEIMLLSPLASPQVSPHVRQLFRPAEPMPSMAGAARISLASIGGAAAVVGVRDGGWWRVELPTLWPRDPLASRVVAAWMAVFPPAVAWKLQVWAAAWVAAHAGRAHHAWTAAVAATVASLATLAPTGAESAPLGPPATVPPSSLLRWLPHVTASALVAAGRPGPESEVAVADVWSLAQDIAGAAGPSYAPALALVLKAVHDDLGLNTVTAPLTDRLARDLLAPLMARLGWTAHEDALWQAHGPSARAVASASWALVAPLKSGSLFSVVEPEVLDPVGALLGRVQRRRRHSGQTGPRTVATIRMLVPVPSHSPLIAAPAVADALAATTLVPATLHLDHLFVALGQEASSADAVAVMAAHGLRRAGAVPGDGAAGGEGGERGWRRGGDADPPWMWLAPVHAIDRQLY